MKVKNSVLTTTLCDVCNKSLRHDLQVTKNRKRIALNESVIHLGNNRHKCKKCYQEGFKSKWKYNLNPLERSKNNGQQKTEVSG